jgi:hypothetical protein
MLSLMGLQAAQSYRMLEMPELLPCSCVWAPLASLVLKLRLARAQVQERRCKRSSVPYQALPCSPTDIQIVNCWPR